MVTRMDMNTGTIITESLPGNRVAGQCWPVIACIALATAVL